MKMILWLTAVLFSTSVFANTDGVYTIEGQLPLLRLSYPEDFMPNKARLASSIKRVRIQERDRNGNQVVTLEGESPSIGPVSPAGLLGSDLRFSVLDSRNQRKTITIPADSGAGAEVHVAIRGNGAVDEPNNVVITLRGEARVSIE